FQVLNILATLIPPFWSPWHENIILWLRLVEGLVIPLVFYLTDSHHRSALRRAFQRRSGKFSDFGDDRHSPLYLEGNTKLSPFGSVTPIGIITNYRRTPGKKGKLQHSSAQKKSLWRTRAKKQILPSVYGVDTVLSPSHLTSNLQTVVQTKPQPEKDDVTKLSSLQMDAWRDADAHIYATLSDNLSNLSYQSSLPEDNVFGVGGAEAEEEIYGGSLTTVANADFEFHYTCLGDVRSGDVFCKYDSEMELSGSEEEVWKYPDNSSEKSSISETVQDLVIHIDSPKDSSRVKGSPENEKTVQKTRHQSNDIIPFHVYRLLTEELSRSISPRPQNSWFSMNDLDHIGDKSDSTNSDSEEAVFVVPVKSESMMSLYKIPLPLDNTPSKSRSESNLFWRRNSSDLQHKPSLKEEQFASEGKLLDVLWKNNRSSLLLGRSSRVRKAKKRKTNNKQKHYRNQFSRKSQEELVGTIRLDTGPVLSEENMQPPNTLQNVLASGEKNEKDNLRSTVKPEFV
ncbi:uncharacterized protein LOC111083156, partial [Limulus polyphemus]|uniref:Uncharacterized protein LOC111083156 n=1 Tax=Limulus polyphemus TaxID=6850 RepID=A0ABM1RUV6_LIMPO